MDLSFARSRRRAAARRAAPPVHGARGAQAARALLVGAAVVALAGSIVAEAETPAEEPKEEPRATAPGARACPVPAQFRRHFTAASRETGIPLSLLVAVAYVESNMDPDARSHAGAEGLLQLMPATARELRADATVPDQNVRAGARYLDQMLERFGGDLELALAAYNAGPNAVAEAGGAPSFETLAYVFRVKARAASLNGCS